MTIKLLQLNIMKGELIDNIIGFVKQNYFDILCLQEVAGGDFAKNKADCFDIVKKSLRYQGILSKSVSLKDRPDSYMGNAIIYSPSINKITYKTIPNKVLRLVDDSSRVDWSTIPRHYLSVVFNINGKKLEVLTTHAPWTKMPIDTPDKLIFADLVTQYLKDIKTKYILTGDFNLPPTSEIIMNLNKFSRNLTIEYSIKNTLNPNIHRAKEIFPEGLAVDYIFLPASIKVNSFKLVDKPDLSDHFGLILEFEI